MSDVNSQKAVMPFSQRLTWLTLIAGFWFIADQLHKYYMLEIYDIASKGVVEWLPFMNLVLVWNKGISYGMFQQSGNGSLYLAGFTAVMAIILIVMTLRMTEKFSVIYFSFFIGTALGNGYDRFFRQGVVDVFQPKYGEHTWYVFNIADVAMTIGVILMLIDVIFLSKSNAKED